MLILGFNKFPPQSAKEVAKRIMEMPRLPDYINGRGNYSYNTEEGFVGGLVIYEFDSAKADEALEKIREAYWLLCDVPGFTFQLIPCTKSRETAQKLLELI